MFTSVRFYIYLVFFIAGVLLVCYGIKFLVDKFRQNKRQGLLDGNGTVKERRLTGKKTLLIPTVQYTVELIAPPRYAGLTAPSQKFFFYEHYFPHNSHVKLKLKPADDDTGVDYVVLPLNGVETRMFIFKACLAIGFGLGSIGFAVIQTYFTFIL